jgi:hypothetical protein
MFYVRARVSRVRVRARLLLFPESSWFKGVTLHPEMKGVFYARLSRLSSPQAQASQPLRAGQTTT